MIWRIFYDGIFIPLALLAVRCAAIFDWKANRWTVGRRNLFEKLESGIAKIPPSSKRVWFHSSSMGEFEQAKPIIAELKRRHPEVDVIVSFFSPSGYDHSQSYKNASVITYIPADTRKNAARFVGIVKPSAAIMVRYDVWPNHLEALKNAGVPTFIANATLSANSLRMMTGIKQFHKRMYNSIDHILTVSESDREAFRAFGLTHPVLEVIGDTRFDQVLQRSEEAKMRHPIPESYLSGKRFLVIGSSWDEDLMALLPAIGRLLKEDPQFAVIIIPHEPNVETIERIELQMSSHASTLRFSSINDQKGERCLIVDSIGILTTLYKYAHVAYVGGSFRQGVHNVLEPAVYGIPVLVGPRHENSQEAKQLIALGGAFAASTSDELYERLRLLFTDETKRAEAGKKACDYVKKNAGATQRFLSYLEKVL
jgi:3-deoxy-D-manno-octulosonic-acid transferase